MRRRTTLSIVFAVVLIGAAGCASIMGGGTQQSITFNSSPDGAAVVVDGESRGTTPLVVDLARKNNQSVRLELDGYQPHTVMFDRSVNGWFWGNLLLGGIIGMAIDAANGAMYKLSPEEIGAQLDRAGQTEATVREEAIYIFVTLTPEPGWVKVGQLQSR